METRDVARVFGQTAEAVIRLYHARVDLIELLSSTDQITDAERERWLDQAAEERDELLGQAAFQAAYP